MVGCCKGTEEKITKCLKENPSLVPKLPAIFEDTYSSAIYQIVEKLSISESIFPPECPYRLQQVLDDTFVPPSQTS
jgi:hypothetical protein